ncbi:MAG: WGR and DUF4132 domain-containing protein [Cyanobacteria bacterium SZAS-4]|nr:WGR and DUF4132 domain-containing protein [Cyanobacteria bacterium SZAS-4]
MPRRFECKDGNAFKFWEIEQSGNSVTTWWGRIGTSGQTKTKDFSSDAEAKSDYDKLVIEKTKKGYVEIGGNASGGKAPVDSAIVKSVAVKSTDSQNESISQGAVATVAKPKSAQANPKSADVKSSSVETQPASEDVEQELNVVFQNLAIEAPEYVEKHAQGQYFSFHYNFNLSHLSSVAPIFKLSAVGQAKALIIIIEMIKANAPKDYAILDVLELVATKLNKRILPLNEVQLVTLLNCASDRYMTTPFTGTSVVCQVEEFLAGHAASEALVTAVGKFKAEMLSGATAEEKKLTHRLDAVMSKSTTGEAPIPIVALEAWSDQAIADLASFDIELRRKWLELIEHCSRTTGTTPSATWTKRVKEYVDAVGDDGFVEYFHKWFTLIPKKGSRTGELPGGWGTDMADVFHPQNVEILKGLAYCCVGRTDERLASALGDAAEASFKKVTGFGPRCPKLGTACVHALSSMNTKESVAQLTRVQAKAKHASVKTQIDKALNNAATKSGMSVDDLQDIGVPDFGMQEVGKLTRTFGEWNVQLTIEESDSTALSWISSSGKSQQTVPSEVKTASADAVKELKKIEKDLQKLLPGLRHRIERSYIEQRHWRFDQWRERLLDHPVTATIARRLLWNFNGRAGIWFNGEFIDQSGASFVPDEMAMVELWHPIGADPEVVLHWRRWLMQNKVVQPFKQCHREIYVLTAAEIQTETYSNRFASHILKQHQLQHLCMQRGWHYQLMGSFDFQSTPTLHLPKWDLTVELYVEIPGNSDEAGVYSTVCSDQVRFTRCSKNAAPDDYARRGVVQLTEIMPVVFSEVMRDVDLFISVCSIGTDPNWTQGHREYWHQYSFGDLSNSAQSRKQVLEEIIPYMRIADRCTFDSKFLIVRGDLRTYKIHLGSGNILMEPNDQYLCIVAARGHSDSSPRVFLPFEGDNVLSIILSKTIMLAEDTKIKDPSILTQIHHKA